MRNHPFSPSVAGFLLFQVLNGAAFADDFDLAVPSFPTEGGTAVPIDIQDMNGEIVFDVPEKSAHAKATVNFLTREAGFPMLDLAPKAEGGVTILSATLDGKALSPELYARVKPGEDSQLLRIIQSQTAPGKHTFSVEYKPEYDSEYTASGVRLGFWMDDIGGNYLEQYLPSGFEYDAFKLHLRLQVNGASSDQKLFTNGKIAVQEPSSPGTAAWDVDFPAYFGTSSFFVHLTDRPFHVEMGKHESTSGRGVPVIAYGENHAVLKKVVEAAKKTLTKNEKNFGPFMHEKVLVMVPDGIDRGGGMEYCGATQSGPRALDHELTHSWFARGVMPANGNAGWIDEAVTSWNDQGNPEWMKNPPAPFAMANRSPFYRAMVYQPNANPYEDGALFIASLAGRFKGKDGGLMGALSRLFQEKQGKRITTETFRDFLEGYGSMDLHPAFDRFAFGNDVPVAEFEGPTSGGHSGAQSMSVYSRKHPVVGHIRFTREELRRMQ